MSDARLLFDWRNDSETRKNSFNTDVLIYESHVEWLKNTLDDNVPFFIMMHGNQPIGQIRLNESGGVFNISYSIAIKHRGQGYGKEILLAVESRISRSRGRAVLRGEVKNDNVASYKAFERLGYVKKSMGEYTEFTKILEA